MRCFRIAIATFVVGAACWASDPSSQQVDQIFAEYAKPGSPGCSVGAIRDGNFVYKKSFGEGSLEFGVPLTSESVFYMGSVSKQFTAAAVVLAAEKGFLSLDDDVQKYLPELPDYGHPVTLLELIHQTSGFRDFMELEGLAGRDPASLSADDALKLIAQQKGLNNVPGGEWIYSNSNYFLLGEIVQRATKKTLAQFSEENIFKPLGMTHTRFYDDHTLVLPGRVAAYDPGKDGTFKVDWNNAYELVGGGGLMSTVDDMLLWDRNFYENKLGSGSLVKELQSHGKLNNGNQIDYAMGLSLGNYRGLPTVAHDGALYGYRTAILRFPQQKFSVVTLCNLGNSNPEGLSRKVADLYLANDFKAPEVPKPGGDLPDPTGFAGTYLDPRTHNSYTFTVKDGKLMAWGAALQRIGTNQYYDFSTNIITFDPAHGKVNLALVGEPEFFVGSKVVEPKLTESELAAFAGEFHSEEIDANYGLMVEKGKLMLHIHNAPELQLAAVGKDEFRFDELGSLVFERDKSGRVSGFTLIGQRVRGLVFKRMGRKP
ncbi:MAG TPA: serine hydrolase domain-containing protein [Candidatus Koribacter sp.]|jgi:CubicO group peptidase (beta-lactamase class C family)